MGDKKNLKRKKRRGFPGTRYERQKRRRISDEIDNDTESERIDTVPSPSASKRKVIPMSPLKKNDCEFHSKGYILMDMEILAGFLEGKVLCNQKKRLHGFTAGN